MMGLRWWKSGSDGDDFIAREQSALAKRGGSEHGESHEVGR